MERLERKAGKGMGKEKGGIGNAGEKKARKGRGKEKGVGGKEGERKAGKERGKRAEATITISWVLISGIGR